MGHLKLLALTGAFAIAIGSACQRNDSNTAPASGGAADNNNHLPAAGSASGSAQGESAKTPDQYDANNTGRNERDRSGGTLTSEDQGGSDADREVTRQIRRALTSDNQLSTAAKNIKIITTNGKVTLRGPVDSTQEQEAVATAAKGVNGVTSVDNQLEVKQNKQ